MDLFSLRGGLTRTGEQLPDFALGHRGFPGGVNHGCEGTASSVEQLRRRVHFFKRLDHCLPGRVEALPGNLLLTCQNLPESKTGLKRSHGISAERVIWDFSQSIGRT